MRHPGEYRGTATDLLVEIWQLAAQGRDADARQKLLGTWCWFMDGLVTPQPGRVALRLFERFGFCTDSPDEWARLPEPLTIYRGGPMGVAWTTERETVEFLGRVHDLTPIRTATVQKRDVLAYITQRGEDEIIVRPERVHVIKLLRSLDPDS